MNYDPTLESRPHAPLVYPIPMVEMAIPLPGAWLDEVNAHGMDPGRAVVEASCQMLHYSVPCPVSVREDFATLWAIHAGSSLPAGESWERVFVPIRQDAWQCIEQATAMVGRPAHEVFLKVLARLIRLAAEEVPARRHVSQSIARDIGVPANVTQGPWIVARA